MARPYKTSRKIVRFRSSGGRFRKTAPEDIGVDSSTLARGGEACGQCGVAMSYIIARPICDGCAAGLVKEGRRHLHVAETPPFWTPPHGQTACVRLLVDGSATRWWATGPVEDALSLAHADIIGRTVNAIIDETVATDAAMTGRFAVEQTTMRVPDRTCRAIVASPDNICAVLSNDTLDNVAELLSRCGGELSRWEVDHGCKQAPSLAL